MSLLSRDAILGADDLQQEDVEVPEWGGSVRVRGMSGAERDAYEAARNDESAGDWKTRMINYRAHLVALTVVDEKGKPVFRDKDVEGLGKKSAAALDRVVDVAMRLSGMRAEDVEDLAKNSGPAQNGAATSG